MKHAIEEMTFVEFREAAKHDPVIIIPLGSQETQGPCNPMGDFMLVRRLANEVASRTGCLVAPTVPFGFADCFSTVPGGIQVSPETFMSLVRDVLLSFLNHGLRRLVIMNGHTGNSALIDLTVRRLRQERGALVPWINIWPLASTGRRNEAHGANAGQATGHGADPIGSVYEYYYPNLTRRELATTEGTGKTFFGLPTSGLQSVDLAGTPVHLPVRVDDHCDYVVGGDPSLANAAAGRIFADFIVAEFSKLVEHVGGLPAEQLVEPKPSRMGGTGA